MKESSRQERIIRTSLIGILVNLLIAAVKIVIGTLASSIAIVSEGINNATDAGSSFLTYVGTKLSGKHPDEKHPFGYGRIEYLTGMVVGILILYAGISMLKESIDGILHPSDMKVSMLMVLIVAGTAVTKFCLGMYTIKIGKSVESEVLLAVGEDGRNDSFFSGLTILSSVIFLFTGFSLDAYAGIVFSFVVIKSGVDALKNTASDLIGRSGKEELARQLYKEIRATDGVISAIDMMLHDYGPDRYSGSVNIEIDHKRSIGEVYEEIHRLQLRIMEEYHVTMQNDADGGAVRRQGAHHRLREKRDSRRPPAIQPDAPGCARREHHAAGRAPAGQPVQVRQDSAGRTLFRKRHAAA